MLHWQSFLFAFIATLSTLFISTAVADPVECCENWQAVVSTAEGRNLRNYDVCPGLWEIITQDYSPESVLRISYTVGESPVGIAPVNVPVACGIAEWILPTLAVLPPPFIPHIHYKPGDELQFMLQAHWLDYSQVTFFDVKVRIIVDSPCGERSLTVYEQPELFFPPCQVFVKLTDWVIPAEFALVDGFKIVLTYSAVYSSAYVDLMFDKISIQEISFVDPSSSSSCSSSSSSSSSSCSSSSSSSSSDSSCSSSSSSDSSSSRSSSSDSSCSGGSSSSGTSCSDGSSSSDSSCSGGSSSSDSSCSGGSSSSGTSCSGGSSSSGTSCSGGSSSSGTSCSGKSSSSVSSCSGNSSSSCHAGSKPGPLKLFLGGKIHCNDKYYPGEYVSLNVNAPIRLSDKSYYNFKLYVDNPSKGKTLLSAFNELPNWLPSTKFIHLYDWAIKQDWADAGCTKFILTYYVKEISPRSSCSKQYESSVSIVIGKCRLTENDSEDSSRSECSYSQEDDDECRKDGKCHKESHRDEDCHKESHGDEECHHKEKCERRKNRYGTESECNKGSGKKDDRKGSGKSRKHGGNDDGKCNEYGRGDRSDKQSSGHHESGKDSSKHVDQSHGHEEHHDLGNSDCEKTGEEMSGEEILEEETPCPEEELECEQPLPELEFPINGVFEFKSLSKILIGFGVANAVAAILM